MTFLMLSFTEKDGEMPYNVQFTESPEAWKEHKRSSEQNNSVLILVWACI